MTGTKHKKIFETDPAAAARYWWCGALVFTAEAAPVPAVLLAAPVAAVSGPAAASVLAMCLCYAAVMAVVRIGQRRTGTRLGRRFAWKDLPFGAMCAAALYPSATMAATVGSALFGPGPSDGADVALLADGAGTYMAVLALAVVPAISEELMVRGFLYGVVRERRGAWPAVIVTALCFGLLHPGGAQALYAAYCGLALAMLREATGGIWAGIAMHCALNLAAVFFSLPCSAQASYAIGSVPAPVYAGIGTFLAGALFLALRGMSDGLREPDARMGPPFVLSPGCALFIAGAAAVRMLFS